LTIPEEALREGLAVLGEAIDEAIAAARDPASLTLQRATL
jgi:hypothetical protein